MWAQEKPWMNPEQTEAAKAVLSWGEDLISEEVNKGTGKLCKLMESSDWANCTSKIKEMLNPTIWAKADDAVISILSESAGLTSDREEQEYFQEKQEQGKRTKDGRKQKNV